MLRRTLVASLATVGALALTSAAYSQSDLESQNPVTAAFSQWQLDHGDGWRLTRHTDQQTGQFLWGSKLDAPFTPTTDADWFELARLSFEQAYDIFAISNQTLVPVRVKYLSLQQIGTTDKVSVEFLQAVNGIPVIAGSVQALFTPKGELLALDSLGISGIERLSTAPAANAYAAADAAVQDYIALEQREPSEVSDPELVILKSGEGKFMEGRLAWSMELRNRENPENPAGRTIFIAADSSALSLLQESTLIHNQQAGGTVQSYATPGTAAHSAANPPSLHIMPFMNVTSTAGNTTTDANGNFSINVGNNNPLNVTATYTGPYCRVLNQAGANHSTTTSFTPGTPGTLTMNAGQTEFVTSEASCYDSVLDVRAWIKSIDPSDNHADFQVTTNANLNATCNAYYDGVSINMYRAGGGCNNTGFSTIVAHEEGHWLNSLYGSGNGSDGFGEGNGDVYSMYVYDVAEVGTGFFTGGGIIRTGNNNRQFCGDNNGGCYGEVHADGEVLMGALWKVRQRLNTSLGNSAGDLTADTLFVAWMNAYNDGQIKTIIEEHWLVLDDNDGNILNGTPNYADIDGGFRQQGFPGVDLALIQIAHTPLGDSLNETGPYVVSADITSLVSAVITSATVHYTVNGGNELIVPMANTAGSIWSGGIPGQASPARLTYWITSNDSLSNSERNPRVGAYEFVVGVRTQVYFNDFEGATDENWVHALLATQDDWQRGTPAGNAGDPGTAYSGTKAWANDLGLPGWNGSYAANVNNYLESPAIDCTGKSGVTLRFARYLGVEEGIYDRAKILVNGQLVWQNQNNGHTLDSNWGFVEYDISAIADNNPAVKVRFTLTSDAGLEFGGWTIDDFELYTLDAVPPGGTDAILLSGNTSGNAGSSVTYTFSGMEAGQPWKMLGGLSNSGSVIFGHTFDIGAGFRQLGGGVSTAAGTGSITFTIPANLPSGTVGYLEVGAQSSGGIMDSNLFSVIVN